mmetsp:Transcript_1216/g.1360  ORF Transcript_1216/g.1360 Transcript_1216/m.1360 type:complete len:197 (-) Transcript_1216:84-674(-)
MLRQRAQPHVCRSRRLSRLRWAILAALATGSLWQHCSSGEVFLTGERRGTLPVGLQQFGTRTRISGRTVRRAAPQIPLDELAPDEIAQQAQETVLPRLPPLMDTIVGGFLYVFPVVVIASWALLTWTSYEESKKAKERDKKNKIRKAIKIDPNFDNDMRKLEEKSMRKKKKRRKPTAFEESLALEDAAEEKAGSAY